MKLFAKIVAGVLGMALGAAPLLAAVPCTTGTRAMAHCAACCGKMAKSAMTSSRRPMVQAPRLAEFSAPPCCKISSDDTTPPVIAREAQCPVTQAVAQQAVSVLLPWVAPDLRQRVRPLPGPSPKSRPQSALCTFLI